MKIENELEERERLRQEAEQHRQQAEQQMQRLQAEASLSMVIVSIHVLSQRGRKKKKEWLGWRGKQRPRRVS